MQQSQSLLQLFDAQKMYHQVSNALPVNCKSRPRLKDRFYMPLFRTPGTVSEKAHGFSRRLPLTFADQSVPSSLWRFPSLHIVLLLFDYIKILNGLTSIPGAYNDGGCVLEMLLPTLSKVVEAKEMKRRIACKSFMRLKGPLVKEEKKNKE